MRRHVLALVFVVPFIASCSSIFGIGHNSFRCNGTDKGGVCANVDKVYKDRYELAKQGDTVIDKEKDKKKVETEGEKQKTASKTDADITVRVIEEKPFAQPIRVPPQIARVWIQPYVDYQKNLIDGRYVYVIVKKGGWLLPDGTKIYDDEVKEGKDDK